MANDSAPDPTEASLEADGPSMPPAAGPGDTPDSLEAGLTRELAAQLITQQPLAAAGHLCVAGVIRVAEGDGHRRIPIAEGDCPRPSPAR